MIIRQSRACSARLLDASRGCCLGLCTPLLLGIVTTCGEWGAWNVLHVLLIHQMVERWRQSYTHFLIVITSYMAVNGDVTYLHLLYGDFKGHYLLLFYLLHIHHDFTTVYNCCMTYGSSLTLCMSIKYNNNNNRIPPNLAGLEIAAMKI